MTLKIEESTEKRNGKWVGRTLYSFDILLLHTPFQDSRSDSGIQNVLNRKNNLPAYCSLVYITSSNNYDREGERSCIDGCTR